MKTKEQYRNKKCTHREYYAQFVTPRVKRIVKDRFGIEQLVNTPDQENLNTLNLSTWDGLVPLLWMDFTICSLLKSANEWRTLGSGVCILKEAAKQLIEEAKQTA
jgi:hypothetical protein